MVLHTLRYQWSMLAFYAIHTDMKTLEVYRRYPRYIIDTRGMSYLVWSPFRSTATCLPIKTYLTRYTGNKMLHLLN